VNLGPLQEDCAGHPNWNERGTTLAFARSPGLLRPRVLESGGAVLRDVGVGINRQVNAPPARFLERVIAFSEPLRTEVA